MHSNRICIFITLHTNERMCAATISNRICFENKLERKYKQRVMVTLNNNYYMPSAELTIMLNGTFVLALIPYIPI